jgi:hypothetical protein
LQRFLRGWTFEEDHLSPPATVKLSAPWLRFEGKYAGGTFCPSETEWRFLDRGIFEHNRYGRGIHSWTVVQAAEALRVVRMI